MGAEKILEIKDLYVSFDTYAGEVQAVRGITFDIQEGEVLALVGESGCGKSVTAQSIMKLNPQPPGRYKGGSIRFRGVEILELSEKQMEGLRGSSISMILQDPMTSLNPTMTVGKQIMEVLIKHQNMSTDAAQKRAVEMLHLVDISNAESRIKQYPHEFSGGMRQRVCIAIALSCNPAMLIADEPTTALDVTIQAQILDLLRELRRELGLTVILITHDLGVVADIAERVIVMYAGKIVETGLVDDIFYDSYHPYTWGLLKSVPKINEKSKGDLVPITGSPVDLFAPPQGCAFASRCDYAMRVCSRQEPPQTRFSPDHLAYCWLTHPEAPKVVRPDFEEEE